MDLFYIEPALAGNDHIQLSEETSRHVVAVLRMRSGDRLQLADGNGNLLTAEINEAHKKHCTVNVLERQFFQRNTRELILAVSLLKNTSRFEWMLEKVTEIGITRIVPLFCARTEKQQFRFDRMKNILESAMMQSNQYWLPGLDHPTPVSAFIDGIEATTKILVAHCMEGDKVPLHQALSDPADSTLIMIGPEGDFTTEEVQQVKQHGGRAVSLGDTRLRTETACIVAAALLKNVF